MSRVRIELNEAGIRELLKSSEIQETCADAAKKLAPSGYAVSSRTYPERAGAAITAETEEAKIDNLIHNTLEKVIR